MATIELNEYEMQNLLWLLNRSGYPCGDNPHACQMMSANTGDWLGQVALKLARELNLTDMIARKFNFDLNNYRWTSSVPSVEGNYLYRTRLGDRWSPSCVTYVYSDDDAGEKRFWVSGAPDVPLENLDSKLHQWCYLPDPSEPPTRG